MAKLYFCYTSDKICSLWLAESKWIYCQVLISTAMQINAHIHKFHNKRLGNGGFTLLMILENYFWLHSHSCHHQKFSYTRTTAFFLYNSVYNQYFHNEFLKINGLNATGQQWNIFSFKIVNWYLQSGFDEFQISIFYIFMLNRSLLDILPNFNQLWTLKLIVFGPTRVVHFWKNYIFSNSWPRLRAGGN